MFNLDFSFVLDHTLGLKEGIQFYEVGESFSVAYAIFKISLIESANLVSE